MSRGNWRSEEALVPALDEATLLDGRARRSQLIAVRDPLINFKISASEDSLATFQASDAKLAFLSMAVAGFADSAPTEAETREFDKLKSRPKNCWRAGIKCGCRHRHFSKARRRTKHPLDLRARCTK